MKRSACALKSGFVSPPVRQSLARSILYSKDCTFPIAGLRCQSHAKATRTWHIPSYRSKNAKAHLVHLSDRVWAIIKGQPRHSRFVFATSGGKNFQSFKYAKETLDQLSSVTGWRIHDLRRTVVTGMARLGVPPHVADKILNHQSGTISGVAAVYQKHEFLTERKDALDRWSQHGRWSNRYDCITPIS